MDSEAPATQYQDEPSYDRRPSETFEKSDEHITPDFMSGGTSNPPAKRQKAPSVPTKDPSVAAKPLARRNPFARSQLKPTPSLHKSESFFDRVDALEAANTKSAVGEKATKQTTLFGFASKNNKKQSPFSTPSAASLDQVTEADAGSEVQADESGLDETQMTVEDESGVRQSREGSAEWGDVEVEL